MKTLYLFIVLLTVVRLTVGQEEMWDAIDGSMTSEIIEPSSTSTMEPAMTSAAHHSMAPTAATHHTVPMPTPTLSRDNFTIEDKHGRVCFRAMFKATFNIKYNAMVSGKKSMKTKLIDMPHGISTHGSSCNQMKITLQVSWAKHFVLQMMFMKKSFNHTISPNSEIEDAKTYAGWELHHVVFMYDTSDKEFPDASNPGKRKAESNSTVTYFRTPVNESYVCKSESVIQLLENSKDMVNATISMAKFQAFREDYGQEFTCKEDLAKNNVVPIAVGAALAGLLLIVIIAYFIGRRNSRADYESV